MSSVDWKESFSSSARATASFPPLNELASRLKNVLCCSALSVGVCHTFGSDYHIWSYGGAVSHV
jgi:hypothetical protein